jgi:hypothetical protein
MATNQCLICNKPVVKAHTKCGLTAEVTYYNGPKVTLNRDMESKCFLCYCHLHTMGHTYKDQYKLQAHIDKHKAQYYANPTLVGTVSEHKLQ